MKQKHPPIPLIVIIVLVVLSGAFFGVRALLNKTGSSLTASGTIEAVDVTISPEIGGKVAEVLVEEGAAVKTGDVLFRLDETLLKAQRAVAAATLDTATAAAAAAEAAFTTAQAQYALAQDTARIESAFTRTAPWRSANPSGYTLPGWYFSQDEVMTSARIEVDAARSARDEAQSRLADLLKNPASADFVAAETRLINARSAVLVAQDVLDRENAARDNADLLASGQAARDLARSELEDAQNAYDDLKGGDPAREILTARTDMATAQERYEIAQDRWLALQTGEDSPKLAAALAALQQAQAAAEQAGRAVKQSQASLDLLDTQISKLTVAAPSDGVILTRTVQPGEVVAAGASALTLGRLDTLTITVYIPEDRYGKIRMGQTVRMTVDSFPGEEFQAVVIHIADRAEFTPRNVQTVEGRSSTVFAIRLQVTDSSGTLKPGMPADVVFLE